MNRTLGHRQGPSLLPHARTHVGRGIAAEQLADVAHCSELTGAVPDLVLAGGKAGALCPDPDVGGLAVVAADGAFTCRRLEAEGPSAEVVVHPADRAGTGLRLRSRRH